MQAPYDRSAITTGIVHIGVGNFHRSHQAMYVDRLLAAGGNEDWGITGVGMLPGDARVRDGLNAQSGLYSLVLKDPSGSMSHSVIGSILEMRLTPDDPWAVVDLLADPQTRIVSLTITEGGYNVGDATGAFLRDTPAVVADTRPGAAPGTVFAVVVQALRKRRDSGTPPFTVVCCDNIESNGEVARRSFLAFAEMLDPSLASWVADNVAFPSSMVDRITPATTEADRQLVADQFGVEDLVPVTAEPFVQWVLEDHFTNGRPSLEDVGVQLVADVRPYELMKLRLLNASHQALAYFGLLLGHEHVHEGALDEDLRAYVAAYMSKEGAPTLEPVPGVDLIAYQATLLERFGNPAVLDTMARLGCFGSDRLAKFVLPVVRDNLAAGRSTSLSTAVVASWLRYTEVMPDVVVDNRWKGHTPEEFLTQVEVFGDLVEHEGFNAEVLQHLAQLRRTDVREVLRSLS